MMTNKSESIAKLAMALSRLQGEVTDAHKDRSAYNYKYADLAGVLEIVRPLCLKFELAVSQLCTSKEGGVGVTTILMHSSGEWLESELVMSLDGVKGGNQAQAAGAVITYARRYALAAILGITQTDNDAQSVALAHVEVHDWHEDLKDYCLKRGVTPETARGWCSKYGVERLSQLDNEQIKEVMGVK